MGGIEFKDVARLVSCREFAEAEGMKIHNGRCVCPFHPGADGYNLAFFKSDGRAHCYKCNKTADVVQLAAAVWAIPQVEAAAELNERFKLGLSAETMTTAERDRREQARRDARELRERVKQAENAEWARACEAEQAAQAEIERFTPEDVNKIEFDQALQRLCAAQMRCDLLQAARAER